MAWRQGLWVTLTNTIKYDFFFCKIIFYIYIKRLFFCTFFYEGQGGARKYPFRFGLLHSVLLHESNILFNLEIGIEHL